MEIFIIRFGLERVEGIYRDTLSRVESTADALWSELGCDWQSNERRRPYSFFLGVGFGRF